MTAWPDAHLRLVPKPRDVPPSRLDSTRAEGGGCGRAEGRSGGDGLDRGAAPPAWTAVSKTVARERPDTKYLRLLFRNVVDHVADTGTSATCVALAWALPGRGGRVTSLLQGVEGLLRFVRRSVRSTDVVGRLAQDVVCVVLPGQTTTGGLAVAKRLVERWRESATSRGERLRERGVVAAVIFLGDALGGESQLLRSIEATIETARQRGPYVICRYEPGENAPVDLPHLSSGDLRTNHPNLARLVGFRQVRGALDFIGGHRGHPHLDFSSTLRVTDRSLAVASKLGVPRQEQAHLACAALLRDVGMLWLPAPILIRNGPLNAVDFKLVKKHPQSSVRRTGAILTEEARHAIMHHHERVDGRGYPNGLKGRDIPRCARIIAVADAFEAMRSPRPYRPVLSSREAIAELGRGSGKQFDPEIVEAFLVSRAQAGNEVPRRG